jgi:hypothetical protein
MPRARLFRYPSPDDPPHDCHWTTLHIFDRERPALEPLTWAEVMRRFDEGYTPIDRAQLAWGDVILLTQKQADGVESYIHSAVWLGHDLVYTKNGHTPLAPWIIAPLDDVRALYRHAHGGIRYLRRKG